MQDADKLPSPKDDIRRAHWRLLGLDCRHLPTAFAPVNGAEPSWGYAIEARRDHSGRATQKNMLSHWLKRISR